MMRFRRSDSFVFHAALALLLCVAGAPAFGATTSGCAADPSAPTFSELSRQQQQQLDDLEQRTFEFFWDTVNPANGLVPDHWPGKSFSSIAAVGFALTGYGIGAERGWVTRKQAAQRTLTTLEFFAHAPQGDSLFGDSGYHGFFYHFLDMKTGLRDGKWVELSSIDTTLLLGGVLFAQSYFDRDTPVERKIRKLADQIYRRVDWTWMRARPPLVTMGWRPESGLGKSDWEGYDEAMLLYVLALGSPTHALKPGAWKAWTSTYSRTWGEFQGYRFLNFGPLFGHQYSQAWIDFRGIKDAWMRRHDSTYFANSRCAARAQRAYAIANPNGWSGYGAKLWGLTASNGPGNFQFSAASGQGIFFGYTARGAGLGHIRDDGTIAPTAAAASIAFAPRIAVGAIEHMLKHYGKIIYGKYGFYDAFNLSFDYPKVKPRSGRVVLGFGWVDNEYLGIDQGPILLMLENYRSGLVWNVMRRNPYIRRGLERAGFTGGWLEADPDDEASATP
ncbi:MAG TPA: glucoamylase family protein [Oleiagrimonas sp.]|nr:glucoamylase family protein [Oleiagrimonas sp.]